MVARHNSSSDSVTVKDSASEGAGKDNSAALQVESPYQSKNGLADMKQIAEAAQPGKPGEVPTLALVNTSDNLSEKPKPTDAVNAQADKPPAEAIADDIAKMITSTGPKANDGVDLNGLRATHPELAKEVERMGQVLAGRPEAEQKDVLRTMSKLYNSFDGKTDPNIAGNPEAVDVLRQQKFDPAYVQGIQNKADEILQMPKDQQGKAISKVQRQLREFYLD